MTDKRDPRRTAIVVMDFQKTILEKFAAGSEAILPATAAAIAAARAAGMSVIYVVVGFRPGCPEISDRNKIFSGIKAMGGLDTTIHAAVAPKDDEPIIMKRRVGAFFGTELDMILRARDIDTLVLCGVTTSGCVLSTVRHAMDADYAITVLRDCCFDTDTETHNMLMDKIFARPATVTTSAEFVKSAKG